MAEISIRIALQGRDKVQRDLQGTANDVGRVSTALGKMSTLGKGIGRTLESGLRMAATGAGVLAAGLTGVVAAGATVGVKTAANMEQANIAFTTMLGSGKAAQGFLADLNDFAKKTPFDFPGLTTAASSLISAGIDADKVIPIMTSLGNATSGMGTGAEGIQRATVALQQMNAAQKITGEDLNQLRDAGIPVFDLLAAATGKSKEEVAGLAAAGKLGKTELDQLMGALESGQGLEKFSGLMDKQSQSLTGLASSLQDTVSMGLATAMQPLVPLLKDGVSWATQFATDSLPALTTATTKAAGWIRQFLDGFSQTGPATNNVRILGDRARDVFNAISGFVTGTDWGGLWDKITSGVQSVRDAFANVDFSTLGAGLSAFGQSAGDSSVWMDVLKVGSTLLGTALQFVSDHMDTIIKYAPAIVAGLAAWKVMQQALLVLTIAQIPLKAAEIAATFALAASNFALASAMRLANGAARVGFITRVKDLALKVKDAAVIGLMTIRYIAYQIAIGVVTAATKVAAAGQWLWNAAMTANPIGLVIAAIVLLVGGLIWFFTKTELGRKIFEAAWGGIKAAAEAVANWFTGTLVPWLSGVWDAIVSGITTAWDWMKNTLWPGIVAVWTGIKDGVVGVVQSIVQGIQDRWNDVKNGAQTAFDGVKGFIQSTVDKLQGFIDKIKGAVDWVKQIIDLLKNSSVKDILGYAQAGFSNIFGGGRASGGPVSSGTTYLVGEQGPEFFTPGRSGSILSSAESMAAVNASPVSLTRQDGGEDVAIPRQSIRIPVYLNGREIAQAVYDDAGSQMARS